MGPNEISRRCFLEHEISMILVEAHEGVTGGHYVGKSQQTRYYVHDYGGIHYIR